MNRLGPAIILMVITWQVARLFWQLDRRQRFVQTLLKNKEFLGAIDKELLSAPPPSAERYTSQLPGGYLGALGLATEVDSSSIHRMQWLLGLATLAVLAGSYWAGWTTLALCIVVALSSSGAKLASGGRESATEFVLTIAAILHRWNAEDPTGCAEAVQQFEGLQGLHQAVVTAK